MWIKTSSENKQIWEFVLVNNSIPGKIFILANFRNVSIAQPSRRPLFILEDTTIILLPCLYIYRSRLHPRGPRAMINEFWIGIRIKMESQQIIECPRIKATFFRQHLEVKRFGQCASMFGTQNSRFLIVFSNSTYFFWTLEFSWG